jgi:hypothetical protein
MKRKARYLASAIVSLAKPFLLGLTAVGIGLADSGGFASAYLRLLIFPQLIPCVCMFFLFLDEEKYRQFRPLALLLEVGSLIFLTAALFPAIGNPQKLLLAAKDARGLSLSAAAFLAGFAVDFLALIVLVSGARKAAVSAPLTPPDLGQRDPDNAILPDKEP